MRRAYSSSLHPCPHTIAPRPIPERSRTSSATSRWTSAGRYCGHGKRISFISRPVSHLSRTFVAPEAHISSRGTFVGCRATTWYQELRKAWNDALHDKIQVLVARGTDVGDRLGASELENVQHQLLRQPPPREERHG